jgi:two-component system, chemotaxis family, chemotaxis protein CheY
VQDSLTPLLEYLDAAKAVHQDVTDGRPGRVLLIDDDAAVRETLAEGLRLAGFDVAEAASGADGLRILRTDAQVGLVLLDLMMPEMDGWRFRYEQRMDPRLAAVPTIITTGAPLADVVDGELKAQDYLLKPIGIQHLVSVVAHYVRPNEDHPAS